VDLSCVQAQSTEQRLGEVDVQRQDIQECTPELMSICRGSNLLWAQFQQPAFQQVGLRLLLPVVVVVVPLRAVALGKHRRRVMTSFNVEMGRFAVDLLVVQEKVDAQSVQQTSLKCATKRLVEGTKTSIVVELIAQEPVAIALVLLVGSPLLNHPAVVLLQFPQILLFQVGSLLQNPLAVVLLQFPQVLLFPVGSLLLNHPAVVLLQFLQVLLFLVGPAVVLLQFPRLLRFPVLLPFLPLQADETLLLKD